MLPLSKEKFERVRTDEARLAKSLGHLRNALNLKSDGGKLHGILVPVAARVRGEDWDLVEQKKQFFVFDGNMRENMEVVGFSADQRPHLWLFPGVTQYFFQEPYEDCKELLSFPTQEDGNDLSVRFAEKVEEISIQGFDSGDYQEVWVYIRVDIRPVAEQIQVLDSLLADDNRGLDGVWKSALAVVMTKGDYELFTLVNDYYESSGVRPESVSR